MPGSFKVVTYGCQMNAHDSERISGLLERRACSVIQPDITHCGGLTEARRIAALAEVYRVAMAPHNPQGPVSTAASLEFGFATPSYIICEAVHLDVACLARAR